MMIIVLLYDDVEDCVRDYGGNVDVDDVSDVGDFDVVFQYNGLEDGNGVAYVDVDDVGGDDVDDFDKTQFEVFAVWKELISCGRILTDL